MKYFQLTASLTLSISLLLGASPSMATGNKHKHSVCSALPSHTTLQHVLQRSIAPTTANAVVNGGFELHMWATLVANDGTVCAVAKSGENINIKTINLLNNMTNFRI